MIYLDYAANTPVDERVLAEYVRASTQYIANPNSLYQEGKRAKNEIDKSSERICQLIGITDSEVIYTSGASEANNLAIKGVARAYRENGKHIISTGLEHSSVSGALTYLQQAGYEIDLVQILSDGTIDLEHLKELLRKDTVLVTIAYGDSELGICQPIGEIKKLIDKQSPQCFFHTDATQVVGKILLDIEAVDLITFTPHKFYGLNGMGVLLRKKHIILEPLIHGGKSTSIYRSGTPVIAWAVSICKALEIAYEEMEKRYATVDKHSKKLIDFFNSLPLCHINSTEKSLPHFLNVSLKDIKAETVQQKLDEYGICIATKSACVVPNTPSRAVFAVTKDKKLAKCSFRISLSHMTTQEQVATFMETFHKCYYELTE